MLRVSGDPASGDRAAVYDAAAQAAATVPVVRTGPTGVAAHDPLVLATVDGRTAFHPAADRSLAIDVVEALEAGDLRPDEAVAVVDHDPDTESLPVPETGPLTAGNRDVLGPCGWIDPLDPSDYDLVSPDADASAAADAGLLGRGRGDAAADAPVGEVWTTVREAEGDPVVVLNANDTDDRQQADRTLLAGAPIAVLDAVAAVAEHVGADDAVVYLDETETALRRHLDAAIDAVGDDLPVVPQLGSGPSAYRAGAPTAALEALEGNDRIEPRLQPPTPATHGLYGRPTAVHSARTLLQVRRAIRGDITGGTDHDPGTRLFTVAGDVASPATVELQTNASLDVVRGAVEMDGAFKMACVGGVLGGFTETLDVTATQQALSSADLGTEGVVELLNEDRCAVATAGERAAFAADANSGRCVPGREGTKQLAELLRDVYQGSFETEKIRELGRVMHRTSNCRIGARAPRPVTTAMQAFEPEFRAHTDGRCPSGTCTEQL